MLILALECSTALGSVALAAGRGLEDCRFLWRAEFSAGRGQGGKLFTALDEAVARGRQTGERLEEIVVGLGPGSYSGVRQAIAAATGLAFATGARLRGKPSVAALEFADAAPRHVVGDARRGTFYYTAVQAGRCLAGPELLPDAAALRERIDAHPAWRIMAVEGVPADLPWQIEAALPRADHLLLAPAADLAPPPLEPIYLRGVTVTLPKHG